MATRKLDEICAESIAGYSLRPLIVDHLIVRTDDVSATDRWHFGERVAQRHRVKRLRPKTLDGGIRRRLVAVGEEVLSGEFEINPYLPRLFVRLTQRLEVTGIRHVGVVGHLVHQAAADLRDHGA